MFTVIIPTRGRPRYLERAIASVRRQSIKDIDLVVVNDGDQAAAEGARIIENAQGGPVIARIRGAAAAKGDLIAFLDDDDWWIDSRHLARAEEALRGGEFYFADGRMVFEDGSPEESFARDADARSLEQDNTILISTVCYRKALHKTLGSFDAARDYMHTRNFALGGATPAYLVKTSDGERIVLNELHAHAEGGPL